MKISMSVLMAHLCVGLFFAMSCSDSSSDGSSSDTQDNGTDSDKDAVTCSDLTGHWLLTSWTCDGEVQDIASYGLELSRSFSNPSMGTDTIKFFVPVGQSEKWYSRMHGLAVTTSGSNVTLAVATPAEHCATDTNEAGSWGPVTTGIGSESCTHNTGSPGTPAGVTFVCAVVKAKAVTFSMTSVGSDGPCGTGEASVQTWTKQ